MGMVGVTTSVYVLKHAADFAAYFLLLSTPLLSLLSANVLACADAAQGFRLVQFRTPGNEFGVIGV